MARSSRRQRKRAPGERKQVPVHYAPPPITPPMPSPQLHLSQHNYHLNAYPNSLPPGEVLAGWKEVLPDAPERYFSYIEAQARHRQALEKFTLWANAGLAYLTLFGVFLYLVLVLGVVIALILTDHTSGAVVVGSLHLAAILSSAAYILRHPPRVRQK